MDAAIQTNEMFEITFGVMISEMVAGAIADARRSLLEEDEFKTLHEKNRQLLDAISKQGEENVALEKRLKQQLGEQVCRLSTHCGGNHASS